MGTDKDKKRRIRKEREKVLDFLGMDEERFDKMSKKSSGKILGIDYGQKRIGLAMSDREQSRAFVYETFKVGSQLFEKIREVCEREEVDKIVVGLPLGLKGEYTDKTDEVMYFIQQLEDKVKVMVVVEDERLSSVEAAKSESGFGVDEESARIILQAYLDKQLAKNN